MSTSQSSVPHPSGHCMILSIDRQRFRLRQIERWQSPGTKHGLKLATGILNWSTPPGAHPVPGLPIHSFPGIPSAADTWYVVTYVH